jgi:hypothetical protein
LAKGIRNTLRYLAGLYLLLNLCVSTIPRCDKIFPVLQHGLQEELVETPDCHGQKDSQHAAIQNEQLCKCSLVKFVFVTLPNFDPQRYIGFRIQTNTLIQFAYRVGPATFSQEPEPPYPRWSLV